MPETTLNNEIVKIKSDETKTPSPVAANDESNNCASTTGATAATYQLNKFHLRRILNNNTRNKNIALLGTFPDISNNDNAIVIFEKTAFQESDVATSHDQTNGKEVKGNEQDELELAKPSYFCSDLKVQTEFVNNIYGSYRCTPSAKLSGVKATVVYPATDKHIEKYSICQKYIINETPELYDEITLPYITSSQFSLEWVYNILEHKQETERIIFEDPDPENGFILLPDLKWDGRNIENLYVLVIVQKHGIKSLRDLNASHLSLLRNVRTQAAEAIESRYGLMRTQLRMYFHYQPSFYHLHIHINPVRNEAPGIWCEKSHMLDTVINNLELLSDYYQRATLPFVLYDGNKLLELYEGKLTVRKDTKRLADHLDDDKKDDIQVKKLKLINENEEAVETEAVTK